MSLHLPGARDMKTMPAPLSAANVTAITAEGTHRVDRGLYLQIRSDGTRSWLLRYRFRGRMRWMGLGPVRLVNLSEARRKALSAQKLLLDGHDPIVVRDAERRPSSMTFGECAAEYIRTHEAGWKNAKHRYQWKATIRDYANPIIGDRPVDQVDAHYVLKVLKPIWTEKPETASRLRNRIEKVLDWAKVAGLRSGDNPARWRGHLEHSLPPLSRVQTIKHHEAIPHAAAPRLFAELTLRSTTSAKALTLILLTAARTGEVTGAVWEEFDLDADVPIWVVPAARMKGRRPERGPHRVPLSPPAVTLLRSLPGKRTGTVFTGQSGAKPVSDAALRKLLRKLTGGNATVHGLRSTFRDWVAECTDYKPEVAEAALAHALGDDVETAYWRTDQFDQRVSLMADWAAFLAGGKSPSLA